MIQDNRCFELYGFDVLIDENLKPWLIEVNATPSLNASSREDAKFKFKLVNDVLNTILPTPEMIE